MVKASFRVCNFICILFAFSVLIPNGGSARTLLPKIAAPPSFLSTDDENPASGDSPGGGLLSRPVTLYISSIPESAHVFINGDRVGVTPVRLFDILAETLSIRVAKQHYGAWSTILYPRAGDSIRLVASLPAHPTVLSVFLDPETLGVSVDDGPFRRGSLTDVPVSAGRHRLTVRSSSPNESEETMFSQQQGSEIAYRASFGQPSWRRALLALVAPGSPQLLDREYVKGSVFLFVTVALAANAINAQNEYSDRVGMYDETMKHYVAAQTETEAYRLHGELSARQGDLQSYYRYRNISIALFAAGYITSVVDSYLHHLTENRLELLAFRKRADNHSVSLIGDTMTGLSVKIRL